MTIAKVQHQLDPRNPNRIVYRISGETRECVQAKIDEIGNKVAGGVGHADFIGPSLIDGSYRALGDVVVFDAPLIEFGKCGWFGS